MKDRLRVFWTNQDCWSYCNNHTEDAKLTIPKHTQVQLIGNHYTVVDLGVTVDDSCVEEIDYTKVKLSDEQKQMLRDNDAEREQRCTKCEHRLCWNKAVANRDAYTKEYGCGSNENKCCKAVQKEYRRLQELVQDFLDIMNYNCKSCTTAEMHEAKIQTIMQISGFNTRWLAYCRSQNHTPEQQKAMKDIFEFQVWIREHWRMFEQETGTEAGCHCNNEQNAFDLWLFKKYPVRRI